MRKLSERIYRIMLRAYPADFRAEYGPEMAHLFRDRSRREGLAGLWARTMADWLRSVPAQHLDVLVQDLRYSFRSLAKTPAFTATIVLSLALGIGATTAIFSVVYAVLVRPLPYHNPERIVEITEHSALQNDPWFGVSPANFLDWKAQSQAFTGMAAIARGEVTVTGGEQAQKVRSARVSANFFPMLGMGAARGRLFRADEDRAGGEPVVVLSHRFASDPGRLLGTTITMDGEPATVIGILPENFRFFDNSWNDYEIDLWRPWPFENVPPTIRGTHGLRVIARLRPGVSLAQARAEMDAIAGRLSAAYPETNKEWGARVTPLADYYSHFYRSSLVALLGAVLAVLLIACANVASLLTGRAEAREREFTIRAWLGAGRGRLTRQLLTESLLLAVCGGAAGLLLARLALPPLLALAPNNIQRLDEVTLSPAVLAFTVLVTFTTGLGFGLAPVLRSAGRSNRIGGWTVVTQVGLSLILLISSGLLLRSFWHLVRVRLGFEPRHVLAFRLVRPPSQCCDLTGRTSRGLRIWAVRPSDAARTEEILRRLRVLPGVEAAAAGSNLPMGGYWTIGYGIEGRPPLSGRENSVGHNAVTPDYFRVLGVPVLQGRPFTSQDTEGAPGVAIINETLARRYWPNESPVGRRLTLREGFAAQRRAVEIVGVVAAVRNLELRDEPLPLVYVPFRQMSRTFIQSQLSRIQRWNFVVRAKGDPQGVAPAVRKLLAEIDPDQPVELLTTMERHVARSADSLRFAVWLVGLFAGSGLLLSAVGIYGVLSYLVARRTREIGIRMALGARPSNILRLFVTRGLLLTAAGLILGLLGALWATRLLSGYVYGIQPHDPGTFAAVCVFFLLVALLAAWLPARRAACLDPMTTLRSE